MGTNLVKKQLRIGADNWNWATGQHNFCRKLVYLGPRVLEKAYTQKDSSWSLEKVEDLP